MAQKIMLEGRSPTDPRFLVCFCSNIHEDVTSGHSYRIHKYMGSLNGPIGVRTIWKCSTCGRIKKMSGGQ